MRWSRSRSRCPTAVSASALPASICCQCAIPTTWVVCRDCTSLVQSKVASPSPSLSSNLNNCLQLQFIPLSSCYVISTCFLSRGEQVVLFGSQTIDRVWYVNTCHWELHTGGCGAVKQRGLWTTCRTLSDSSLPELQWGGSS